MQEQKSSTDGRETGGSGPRALRRVMQIADLLAHEPKGLSLAEIAAQLDAPKSSLLSILRALVEMRFAERVDDRYLVGPGLFRLAGAITAQWRIAPIARPVMQKLHDATGETVLLAEFDPYSAEIVYIDQIESVNPVRFTAGIGVRRPMYCSGSGRMILAFQDEEWLQNYLDTTEFKRLTEETVTDRDEIERRIRRARIEGMSTSSGEVTDGGAAFSAPVFQRDGSVSYALQIATVAMRLRQKSELYRHAVVSAANELSRLAGYEGPLPNEED